MESHDETDEEVKYKTFPDQKIENLVPSQLVQDIRKYLTNTDVTMVNFVTEAFYMRLGKGKYELTDETIIVEGHTLHRIRLLRDLLESDDADTKKSALGGYVESESNLSQDGSSWIKDDACVFGDARVSGDAWVYGRARVSGNVSVSGNAMICEEAVITDRAQVFGDAKVSGRATLGDNAQAFGHAQVFDDADVSGSAHVFDRAWVFGHARISGNALVCGHVSIGEEKSVAGDSVIR